MSQLDSCRGFEFQPDLLNQIKILSVLPLLEQFDNGTIESLCILNSRDAIVWCNKSFLKYTGNSQKEEVYGRRLGDVWNCENARNCEKGCGNSSSCPFCGAMKSVHDCAINMAELAQCRITRHGNSESLEMLVKSTRLDIKNDQFVLCAIIDISAENRRDVLERIYFHDLANETSSLQILCKEKLSGNTHEELMTIKKLVLKLIDRINSHRDFAAAEKGELLIRFRKFNLFRLLRELFETYEPLAKSKNINLEMPQKADNLIISSEPVILSRILGNILKNSIEACDSGQTVALEYSISSSTLEVAIHNPSIIPHEHQSFIFQRSFTTKGKGRGLGTYSVKLFTERYLGGSVSFTSLSPGGTIFRIKLPLI